MHVFALGVHNSDVRCKSTVAFGLPSEGQLAGLCSLCRASWHACIRPSFVFITKRINEYACDGNNMRVTETMRQERSQTTCVCEVSDVG